MVQKPNETRPLDILTIPAGFIRDCTAFASQPWRNGMKHSYNFFNEEVVFNNVPKSSPYLLAAMAASILVGGLAGTATTLTIAMPVVNNPMIFGMVIIGGLIGGVTTPYAVLAGLAVVGAGAGIVLSPFYCAGKMLKAVTQKTAEPAVIAAEPQPSVAFERLSDKFKRFFSRSATVAKAASAPSVEKRIPPSRP